MSAPDPAPHLDLPLAATLRHGCRGALERLRERAEIANRGIAGSPEHPERTRERLAEAHGFRAVGARERGPHVVAERGLATERERRIHDRAGRPCGEARCDRVEPDAAVRPHRQPAAGDEPLEQDETRLVPDPSTSLTALRDESVEPQLLPDRGLFCAPRLEENAARDAAKAIERSLVLLRVPADENDHVEPWGEVFQEVHEPARARAELQSDPIAALANQAPDRRSRGVWIVDPLEIDDPDLAAPRRRHGDLRVEWKREGYRGEIHDPP